MITVKKVVEKKEIVCPHCKAVLEYEDDDVHDIYEGLGFTCPQCGEDIVLFYPVKPIFPVNFYHFGVNDDAVELTNEETQRYVDEVFKHLRNVPIGEYYYTGTGNTMVFGVHHEDEIIIWVNKDYYEFSYSLED